MNNNKPQSDKQAKENYKQQESKKNFLEGKKCLKDPMELFEDEE